MQPTYDLPYASRAREALALWLSGFYLIAPLLGWEWFPERTRFLPQLGLQVGVWGGVLGAYFAAHRVRRALGEESATIKGRQHMPSRKLQSKVAVVTGASSGVGRAIARAYGEEGAKVALVARDVEGLEAAAGEIRHSGGEAIVLPLDVSDAQAVEAAADTVVSEWGRIDIWVNDAMVGVFSPVSEMKPEEYRRVTDVNYLGYVHGTLAALKHMRPRNSGVIIQIGSALAYRSIPLQSAYCASKAAIRGFTDSLRSELFHEKSAIKLTHLHLPAVNTPQFGVVRNRLPKHPHPVPPIYQPEVIARAAVWAALHPTRELWIGWSTAQAILGQRVIPGLLDRYLAKKAWKAQQTDKLPPSHQDNVDTPVPGDRGARGPFDDEARPRSTELWGRTHPKTVAGIAVGLLALLGTRYARRRALRVFG